MIRQLILFGSAATVGFALYLVKFHVQDLMGGDHWAAFYISQRVGVCVIILLVAEAVAKATTLAVTWRLWAYTAALFMIAVGFLGIGVEQYIRRKRKR